MVVSFGPRPSLYWYLSTSIQHTLVSLPAQDFVARWIASHDRVAKQLGKPVYLGEFSTSGEGYERDTLFKLVLEVSSHVYILVLCRCVYCGSESTVAMSLSLWL